MLCHALFLISAPYPQRAADGVLAVYAGTAQGGGKGNADGPWLSSRAREGKANSIRLGEKARPKLISRELVPTSRVWPSAGAFATAAVATIVRRPANSRSPPIARPAHREQIGEDARHYVGRPAGRERNDQLLSPAARKVGGGLCRGATGERDRAQQANGKGAQYFHASLACGAHWRRSGGQGASAALDMWMTMRALPTRPV